MSYKLMGKITDVKGECDAGHKVGEEIDLTLFNEGGTVKGLKLCLFFMDNIFPYLCVMQFGGQLPWEKDPNVSVASCPDWENMVKIRIERIPVGK